MKTGGQMPVEIIAEIDRKIDDGKPATGAFQFSPYVPTASFTAPTPHLHDTRPLRRLEYRQRGDQLRRRQPVLIGISNPTSRRPCAAGGYLLHEHRAWEGRGMPRQTSGFTLVEMAIVVLIVGSLVALIVQGQELIRSARVRSLTAQQSAVSTAVFGFQDRYRALPGDYAQASANSRLYADVHQRKWQRPHRGCRALRASTFWSGHTCHRLDS